MLNNYEKKLFELRICADSKLKFFFRRNALLDSDINIII